MSRERKYVIPFFICNVEYKNVISRVSLLIVDVVDVFVVVKESRGCHHLLPRGHPRPAQCGRRLQLQNSPDCKVPSGKKALWPQTIS